MSYDSLLLDHDGVLVSVLDDATRSDAFREYLLSQFQAAGIESNGDAVIEALNGGPSREEVLELSEEFSCDPEALWQCRDEALATALKEAARNGEKTPYEDIDVVADLESPVGIVSNNQTRVIEFILDSRGVLDAFDVLHARDPTLDSLAHKKPDPTLLRKAMDDMGVENPLYVGDKESDVIAGNRASLDVALLRREHNADRAIDTQPTYEVSSLSAVVDLLP